jgi:hypothetical protein
MNKLNKLIFVDYEANGACIGKGDLTEFGAVSYPEMKTFYGNIEDSYIEIDGWLKVLKDYNKDESSMYKYKIFLKFADWLKEICEGNNPIFISDNPAFDWQWINYYFNHLLEYNPFGWSARRIGDYYAGLTGNFRNATKWKKLRITKHTHNPVDDAMGNAEAFRRMEAGER